MNVKKIRRGAAALAFAGAIAIGGGMANAQSEGDYPPVTPRTGSVPTTDPVDPVVSPDQPTTRTETTPSGTLPQTGGPGTGQILLIAGAAVAAGVAVTGVAGRRRNENLNAS